MEFLRGPRHLRPIRGGCAVTIGNFDALHRGHQALIRQTRAFADGLGVPATAIIFEPTSREYFHRETVRRVMSLRSKLRGFEALGIDRVICLRFDEQLAALDATDFVDRILVDAVGVKAVAVGTDFRFGCQRQGDIALLRQLGAERGFAVQPIGTVTIDGIRCSSTAVRAALAAADLPKAELLLGSPYVLVGRVRPGLRLGRELGMPTANIPFHRVPALREGVYAVRARYGGSGGSLPAVASLGVRPTLGMDACVLETFVLDRTVDLYGCELHVEFVRYLRGQERFDSLETLARQMQADAQDARRVLGVPA